MARVLYLLLYQKDELELTTIAKFYDVLYIKVARLTLLKRIRIIT